MPEMTFPYLCIPKQLPIYALDYCTTGICLHYGEAIWMVVCKIKWMVIKNPFGFFFFVEQNSFSFFFEIQFGFLAHLDFWLIWLFGSFGFLVN